MITELLGYLLLRHAGENGVQGIDAIAAERIPVPNSLTETVVGREERAETVLPSPVSCASDEAWTRFAKAMQTQQLGDVSASNALGLFEMKPRRLADLGLMRGLSTKRSGKRMVWVGDFVKPMSSKRFLSSPLAQYNAFVDSMKDYASKVKVNKLPDGMTLSGALSILHRAGEAGLSKWAESSGRFKDTEAMYEKVNGIF